MNPIAEELEELLHYGIKKRSGRYPWGSGDNPYQRSSDFLARIEELKKDGWKETPENIEKEQTPAATSTSMTLPPAVSK